jgi:hypothetical protein
MRIDVSTVADVLRLASTLDENDQLVIHTPTGQIAFRAVAGPGLPLVFMRQTDHHGDGPCTHKAGRTILINEAYLSVAGVQKNAPVPTGVMCHTCGAVTFNGRRWVCRHGTDVTLPCFKCEGRP